MPTIGLNSSFCEFHRILKQIRERGRKRNLLKGLGEIVERVVDGNVGEIGEHEHVEDGDEDREDFVSEVELRMVQRSSDDADQGTAEGDTRV